MTIKAYDDFYGDDGQHQVVLDSVRTYNSQTHDIILKYERNRKYVLKMTDKNSGRAIEGYFEAYGVFIVILRLVGLTTDSSMADILLTFQNLNDAQSVYTRHKRPDVEWV